MFRAVFLAACMVAIPVAAQQDGSVPEPTQNPNAIYRLFRTQNTYTLLKLDTRTGQIWQVQWGLDTNRRFTTAINPLVLLPTDSPKGPIMLQDGRFTLSPTANIYTFVLLDQVDGRTWQVQWGDSGHRFILPIP